MAAKNIFLIFSLFLHFEVRAQQKPPSENTVIYKKIDTVSLKLEIVYPPSMDPNKQYPCIIFFYGGGWVGGNINQFKKHANHFASLGMVSFIADYRTKGKQGTTPFESLKDAKSAIRFIRNNAAKFHINKDSIVASGGSAGGHLAAAAALTEDYNETTDNLAASCKPNALILFNPVIDNGPGGYGFERIGKEYKNFSPLHNINKGAPPTLIFLGTKDKLIPVETMQYYKMVMEKVGSRCEVILYEGEEHGFFNREEYVIKTLAEADRFLTSLGYLHK